MSAWNLQRPGCPSGLHVGLRRGESKLTLGSLIWLPGAVVVDMGKGRLLLRWEVALPLGSWQSGEQTVAHLGFVQSRATDWIDHTSEFLARGHFTFQGAG